MAFDSDREFDRQIEVLLVKGYPGVTGTSERDFLALIEPLRSVIRSRLSPTTPQNTPAHAPFALVVNEQLAQGEDLVPLTHLAGGSAAGVIDRNHGAQGLAPYRPIAELTIPRTPVYVVFDIERGEEFRDVRPGDAVVTIMGRSRSPLTIHEGIAVVTQFPEMLEKNHCFMLAGSRRGDRRVPALWISNKAPKLGWCWEGNPHTWLGTASAGLRSADESA